MRRDECLEALVELSREQSQLIFTRVSILQVTSLRNEVITNNQSKHDPIRARVYKSVIPNGPTHRPRLQTLPKVGK